MRKQEGIVHIPDREIVEPGRVVVHLKTKRGQKKKEPAVHTAPRVTIHFEKKDGVGQATLRVVARDQNGKFVRELATYGPSEWKKVKVHRPVFRARPELTRAYYKRQAQAAALLMTEKFGQAWSPRALKIH